MNENRFSEIEIKLYSDEVKRDGFCVLREHFPAEKLFKWHEEFAPLLREHIENQGQTENRGANRYYITLPFENLFADEEIFADADILKIVENLVGEDFVMCQLAADTPLKGSDYQEIHRDAPPLFPELENETPAFQLAVNFPLVDVRVENGAFEVARGTHILSKEEGLKLIENGDTKVEPITMNLGDVMVRDVRGLHRGTPNQTSEPRPMVVIGYSRRWLFRPEVSITIPQTVWKNLSPAFHKMLRFNRIVKTLENSAKEEIYQSFAY